MSLHFNVNCNVVIECHLLLILNSNLQKEERENLEPFSNMTGEESFQSRELEKVIHCNILVKDFI